MSSVEQNAIVPPGVAVVAAIAVELPAAPQQDTPSKKKPCKKRAPSKELTEFESPATKKERFSWDVSMTEALIEIRYTKVSQDKFNKCKSNKEKSNWWTWLTERFNLRTMSSLDSNQVKNRIKALKAEYRAITGAEKATGNSKKIDYPLYWETMRSHFQVGFASFIPFGCT
jgi:hypothetical protein